VHSPAELVHPIDYSSPTPVFEVRGVTKVYRQGEVEVHALRGIDLQLFEGEFVVLLGHSGSGKSTLLNIMGGLDSPTDGTVLYQGRDITHFEERDLTYYRRENVGFVFQFYNLIPSLTARENVALVTEVADDPMDPAEALALVDLGHRLDHFPAQLSGGEQRFLHATLSQSGPVLDRWWRRLRDSNLNRLVDSVLQGNLDLRIAQQRLREARALRQQAGAAFLPQATGKLSYTRIDFGDGGGLTGGIVESDTLTSPLKFWSAGVDVSWEADVFGGRRREARAATARSQAAQEALHAARLATTRARAPTLRAGIETQRRRVLVLRGTARSGPVPSPGRLPRQLPMLRTGLPADLITRRPDIRRAERELAAATEDIGVATANFYPRFSLLGTPSARSLGDLFQAVNFDFQIGPSVSWSIFSSGRNHAILEAANARQRQAMAKYEKAVISALQEVERELATLRAETRHLALVQRARHATAQSVKRVRETRDAGALDPVDVLVEEERLRDAEIAEIRVKSQLILVWTRFHKALGGGWK